MMSATKSSRAPVRALLLWVGGTLLIGAVSGLLGGDFSVYGRLEPPPLSPPAWLFLPVWAALYLAMGTAAFLVSRSGDMDRGEALKTYIRQLGVCALWPLFFFRLGWRLFAFFWLLLLIALVAITIGAFGRHSSTAAWLLMPYLVWLLFAAYLNLGFVVRNW